MRKGKERRGKGSGREREGASQVSEGEPPVSEVCVGASTRRRPQARAGAEPSLSPPRLTRPRRTSQRDANLARGQVRHCNPTLG